uniref:Uncharacterized protein n=1 Tax=Nelumbo nucifera TaxID=4432 RepID=A0A822ZD83_NELNU|nr:TPA_asm: hypothetical protein HUJ06_000753 [Nelumbo nucifera]
MASPIPLNPPSQLQRIPRDYRSLVRLAQWPQLQHHPGPAGKIALRPRMEQRNFFPLTLDSSKVCWTHHFKVGILKPNWLDGANYLGQKYVDGFLCNVWEKVDFIWYYEDVVTKRPVHWLFYTGRSVHVMTFEVGAVLEDAKWQAPVYCFEKEEENQQLQSVFVGNSQEGLMKGGILRSSVRWY